MAVWLLPAFARKKSKRSDRQSVAASAAREQRGELQHYTGMGASSAAACLACSLTSAIVGQPEPSANADPLGFRQQVAAIDRFELEASQLALQRSRSPQVQMFARRMIRDYAATDRALGAAIALTREAAEAATLDPHHRALLNELAARGGTSFDQRYAATQIATNEEALRLFTDAMQKGWQGNLQAFCQSMVVKLQEREALALGLL